MESLSPVMADSLYSSIVMLLLTAFLIALTAAFTGPTPVSATVTLLPSALVMVTVAVGVVDLPVMTVSSSRTHSFLSVDFFHIMSSAMAISSASVISFPLMDIFFTASISSSMCSAGNLTPISSSFPSTAWDPDSFPTTRRLFAPTTSGRNGS